MVAEEFDKEQAIGDLQRVCKSRSDSRHGLRFRQPRQCAISTVRVTHRALGGERQNKSAEMLGEALGALDRPAVLGERLLRAPRMGAPAGKLVDVEALTCSTANLLRRTLSDYIRFGNPQLRGT